MKKIIGISGWKRSGKDTFATMIKNMHTSTSILSLAAPLKDACMLDYGLSPDECYKQSLKELPLRKLPCRITDKYAAHAFKNVAEECRDMEGNRGTDYRIVEGYAIQAESGMSLYWTPRALMIFKGSNQRTMNPDYWLDQLCQKVESTRSSLYLIPDMRYINEADYLASRFGENFVSVRIEGRVETESTDPSERDLDNYKFQWKILNNQGLEELESAAKSFLGDVLHASSYSRA